MGFAASLLDTYIYIYIYVAREDEIALKTALLPRLRYRGEKKKTITFYCE